MIKQTIIQFTFVIISLFLFMISLQVNAYAISKIINAGGNGTNWDKFNPQHTSINAGDSVTWINPMQVAEPHTVTFMKDPGMLPPLFAPFSIQNNTELTPTISSSNAEPAIMPDQSNPNNKVVVVNNVRSSAPVVIDSTKTNITYMQPNAKYTFIGDEGYVNSGWIFPEGQVPPDAPPISSFTLTFEKSGEYSYICIIHSWMAGTINVN